MDKSIVKERDKRLDLEPSTEEILFEYSPNRLALYIGEDLLEDEVDGGLNAVINSYLIRERNSKSQLQSALKEFSISKFLTPSEVNACLSEFSPSTTAYAQVLPLETSSTFEGKLSEIPNFDSATPKEQRYKMAQYLLSQARFLNIKRTGLFIYNGKHFELIEKGNEIPLIRALIPENYYPYLSTADYREITNQVQSDPSIQSHEQTATPNVDALIFENGTYYVKERRFVESFNPDDFCFSMLHHHLDVYNDHASSFALDFIESVCERDQALEQLFWQVIGYLISNANSGKAIIVLWGAPNSGKTTISNILVDILGEENCTSVSLHEFGDRYSLAELMGKKLCLDTDSTGERLSKNTISNLKKVSGGDMIMANMKYGKMFHFYNTCKLLIGTNNLITISDNDHADAFYDRLVVLPFRKTVPEDERNADLRNLLKADRNFFILKGIEALSNLATNSYRFDKVITTSQYQALVFGKEHTLDDFFHSNFTLDKQAVVFSREIVEMYEKYCDGKGFSETHRLSDQKLIQQLKARFNLTRHHSSSARGLRGLAVKPC